MKIAGFLICLYLFLLSCNESNFEEKTNFYKTGNFKALKDLLTQELISDFDNAELYFERANAKIKLKDYCGAINDCQTAISKQSNYVKAYLRLGEIYYSLEKYNEAIKIFNKALQVNEQRWHKIYFNQSIYRRLKDNPEDTTSQFAFDFGLIFELQLNEAGIKEIRGVSFGENGRLEEAIKDYNYVLFNTGFSKGFSIEQDRRLTKMIYDYYVFNSNESISGVEYFNAGLLNYLDCRYINSIADFTKFIQRYPENLGGYYQRAISKININCYEDAIKDIKKAITLYPSDNSMQGYHINGILPECLKPLNHFYFWRFSQICPSKEKLIEVLQETVKTQVVSEQILN